MKIYSVSYYCSYVNESFTKVFVKNDEAIEYFNNLVKKAKKEIKYLKTWFEIETDEEEYLLSPEQKSFSYYDGDEYHLFCFETHEV